MRTLSNKDKKNFLQDNSAALFGKKDALQYDDRNRVYLVNGKAAFLDTESAGIIPFLKSANVDFSRYPNAIIDMPAVPFICNGADLLRPGVVRMDDFKKGDILIIRDEKNNVKLAVMVAVFDSSEAEQMEKGRIARSLHCFDDRYWKEY